MAAEQGLEVDREAARLMQEQRDQAKADAKAKKAGHADTHVWREFRERGATEFRAYQEATSEGRVVGLVRDRQQVELEPGQRGQVIWTARRSTPSRAARSPTRASSPPTGPP